MVPITSKKLDALTGLRALAALAVFAHHFMGIMDCRVIRGPIGGIAVSFFFVLSGFILVYVYKGRLDWSTTRKFYFTRFARIWPLHVACLLLIALLVPNYLAPTDFPWPRAWSHWSLLQAWYPTSNWLGGYNNVAWSISAEAFFYLMFPLLLLGTARRFWMKYACLFLVTVGALIWVATSFGPVSSIKEVADASLDVKKIVHFFPAFRLLEFATGMATGMIFLGRNSAGGSVAFRRAKGDNGWKTASATVLEVLVLALSMGCHQIFTYCGVFAYFRGYGDAGITINLWVAFCGGMFFHAAVIYVFARSTGLFSRLFGSPTMVFLGEISFAFYMIHTSVIRFVKHEFWYGTNFSTWYFAVLTLVLTIGVSAWLYYLVEVPAKATLLKWYDGKYRFGQLLSEMLIRPVQRLSRTPMMFALILLIIVPVVVTKLYKRADRKSFTAQQVLESVSPRFQPVSFGDHTELLAADVVPRRNAILINSVWRFSRPATATINLHFSGTEFESRQKKIVCSPENVGRPLFNKLIVFHRKCEPADAIDVSLSIDGKEAAPRKLQREHAGLSPQRYRVFSREQIQEGLRVSKLPVLTR